ncbi:Fic family protein [Nocardioides hankookensis]
MPFLEVLNGTPYSLPSEAAPALVEMTKRLRNVRRGLDRAIEQARRMGLIAELDRAHAVFTVFESNSLEFEGPDLAGTLDAIESTEGQAVIRSLNANLLPEVLRRDPEAFAAIGLEMARVVANRYVRAGNRGMSQSDLRSLHSIVVKGSWYAGQYRSFDAAIADSLHKPFPTYAIPQAMGDYAAWSQKVFSQDLAILRAAIGHAWFTHVHPFQDGNGRVARLTTNVMLGQDGLPPAIVKARSQRGQYLAALSHSDEGGDILPLTGLFLDTVERYIGELRKPRVFQKMFNEIVQRRGDSYFEWYRSCVRDFLERLGTELALSNLTLHPIDEVTREVFNQLRRDAARDAGSPAVLMAIVTDDNGQELALYQTRTATPPSRTLQRPEDEEAVPAIRFALRNAPYSLSPWRRARATEVHGLQRVWVQPDRPVRLFIDGLEGQTQQSVMTGVPELADRIARAFAGEFMVPREYHGSSRWMSRVNGGPG